MDILQLLESKGLRPRKAAGTHGGEWACGCPRCGDGGKPETSDRFRAWPFQSSNVPGGTWYCRKCDTGGDVIEFLRHVDGLNYAEACRALGLEGKKYAARRNMLSLPKATSQNKTTNWQPKEKEDAPASDIWREHAAKLVAHAMDNLEKDLSVQAWLEARGIPMEVARRHRLGWLPGEKGKDYYRHAKSWGAPEKINPKTGKPSRLWIPSGLVIPQMGDDGRLQRVRIRRSDASMQGFPANDSRYIVLAGGDIPSPTKVINPNARGFVVVEAELDAIACAWAAEKAGLDVGSMGMGNNVTKPDASLHAILQKALCILVALDFDEPDDNGQRPGATGAKWWLSTYPRAKRYMVPQGKDPGDAVKLGVDLGAWISAGLPPVFKIGKQGSQTAPQTCPQTAHKSPLPKTCPTSHPQAPSQTSGKNMTMCRHALDGMSLRGAGDDEISRRPPWFWLQCWPPTPSSALMALEFAGLKVERVQSDWGNDFKLSGWQRWPLKWQAFVIGWCRTHGDKVVAALYPQEEVQA